MPNKMETLRRKSGFYSAAGPLASLLYELKTFFSVLIRKANGGTLTFKTFPHFLVAFAAASETNFF